MLGANKSPSTTMAGQTMISLCLLEGKRFAIFPMRNAAIAMEVYAHPDVPKTAWVRDD